MRLAGVSVKGAVRMPKDNDSRVAARRHRRGLPGETSIGCVATATANAVDMCRRRRGRGRVTLAQRLARAGWRIVIIETGRSGIPTGTGCPTRQAPAPIYWTEKRIIGGDDPVEMGKNNSGVGVGGSMIHYAGYVPRFHPSDFEVRTRRRCRGRLADLRTGI